MWHATAFPVLTHAIVAAIIRTGLDRAVGSRKAFLAFAAVVKTFSVGLTTICTRLCAAVVPRMPLGTVARTVETVAEPRAPIRTSC